MERRKALEDEIVDKEREMAVLTQRWNAEKSVLEGVKGAKEKLETARHDLQTAEVCAYSAYSLASVHLAYSPSPPPNTYAFRQHTRNSLCVPRACDCIESAHGCCGARIAPYLIIPAVVMP